MNKIKNLCRALALFSLSQFPSSSQALTADDISAIKGTLGSERLEQIQKTIRDDYRVDLHWGKVQGKSRLIVQLGETHAKSVSSLKSGLELLKHFSLRGFEKTLPENLLARVGDRAVRASISFMSNGLHKKAPEGPLVFQAVPDLQFDSINAPKKQEVENIGLETDAHHSLQFVISGSLLTLHLLSLPITAAALSLQYLLFQQFHFLKTLLVLSNLGYARLQIHGLANMVSHRSKLKQSTPYSPWIYPVADFLIHKRNRVMVKNLISVLENRPESDLIIIVTGSAHSPGMGHLLQKEHGFQKIPLFCLLCPFSCTHQTPVRDDNR